MLAVILSKSRLIIYYRRRNVNNLELVQIHRVIDLIVLTKVLCHKQLLITTGRLKLGKNERKKEILTSLDMVLMLILVFLSD